MNATHLHQYGVHSMNMRSDANRQIAMDCTRLASARAPQGTRPDQIVGAASEFFDFVTENQSRTTRELILAALDKANVI